MGQLTISMAIFHGYVSLPEGNKIKRMEPPQTQSPSCWLTQMDRETGRKKQSSATDRQRRRIILDHYLNGNINSKTVVHFSSMLRDRDEVLEEFRLFVVPALLPKTCPVLNRSKWLGCEESFRWLGLLLSHHNLLSRVMKRWKGGGQEMAAEATLEGPEIGGFDLGPPRLSSWATHPTH